MAGIAAGGYGSVDCLALCFVLVAINAFGWVEGLFQVDGVFTSSGCDYNAAHHEREDKDAPDYTTARGVHSGHVYIAGLCRQTHSSRALGRRSSIHDDSRSKAALLLNCCETRAGSVPPSNDGPNPALSGGLLLPCVCRSVQTFRRGGDELPRVPHPRRTYL